MRALSGLTPALSRRLQRELLAHLPPAAARSLRRTLSLHSASRDPAPHCLRSRSATKTLHDGLTDAPLQSDKSTADNTRPLEPDESIADNPRPLQADKSTADNTRPLESDKSTATVDTAKEESEAALESQTATTPTITTVTPTITTFSDTPSKNIENITNDDIEIPTPQFSTLPRLKRHSTLSRESTPPTAGVADVGYDYTPKLGSLAKELSHSRGSSIRSTPDRPLLSKYLTPERNLSLDESYSSDSGSILSEPSYIAAYGSPAIGSVSGLGFRRHSMRLTGDQPRKRISRFLRPDFFDTPPDETIFAKHKKEKELETQKILREIREKKNRSLDSSSIKSPTDNTDVQQIFKDEVSYPRKCLSPINILTGKDRSRSNTPYFPMLDNIKETTLDTAHKIPDSNLHSDTKQKSSLDGDTSNQETKLSRPKSYPIKNVDTFSEPKENILTENTSNKESENKEKSSHRESKLIRPKSYPASSPSPDKLYVNRNIKNDDSKITTMEELISPNIKNDVEVSFNVSLPKKKLSGHSKADLIQPTEQNVEVKQDNNKESSDNSLVLKKYQIINNEVKSELKEQKTENGTAIGNSVIPDNAVKTTSNEETKLKVINHASKKEDVKLKSSDAEASEKKGTIKKKIIKKVSSKSKTDVGSSQEGNDAKGSVEKKKVTKKVKEKGVEDGTKSSIVTKKKSVLQSIGHKLEKLASTKSNSPEKISEKTVAPTDDMKEKASMVSRTQREQSVPVNVEPPTESNLIKRAVTLTDVAALDSQSTTPSKITVSKVLGLFKKFEPKEKVSKPAVEKSNSENLEAKTETNIKKEPTTESVLEGLDKDKPKRPTSLLLNGLGRKNKYGRTSSDSVSVISVENDDQSGNKKEVDSKNLRNSLKLDFSRLPRVKKIVPTNSVIEPQIMNFTSDDKETNKINVLDKHDKVPHVNISMDTDDTQSRSRSRSRSTVSNSDVRSDSKAIEKNVASPSDNIVHHPLRNHESTTPEKEDIVDRIRRKSFYSRFNEKKQRRKSNLVGPGAAEYDPVARLHSQPTETKYDISPTSPGTYDLSPGFSVASDLSPSTERYRSLLNDLPVNPRSNLKFDNYGLNDKIDTYRSLDRNDFRKYPGSRSYFDYDQPSTYGAHRYSRTKSLLDSANGTEDNSLAHLRDSHKYNRTISMYSPGNYATYRPKRTRNSAIILKESDKEPSPENILDKIRQRKKMMLSVTRKPDPDKEPSQRSNVPSKGEGDGAERSEKAD